jgi:prepilin-type N-terminal cleavage/methylation domain-containing protein
MQHRRAGFTLVEILTVVIIIALLSAVGLLAYNAIQTDTNQRQADGLSRSLRAGMEAYYRKNGEYPSVPTLTGGAVNGTGMTDTQYRSIGTLLNVPSTALNKSRFIFVPCEATTCTNIQNTSAYANTVYYITRSVSDTVS